MSDLTRPPTDVAASHPELVPFGDALRDARERSGLSMGQVARAIGATVVAVSDIERGRVRPSDDDVHAFASTIGADPEPLLALLPPVTRPSPFAPWLPMYGAGVVEERPWWRSLGMERWQRADGRGIGVHGPGVSLVAALDAYDAAHPMPVPPPMAGQVWATPDGSQVPVGYIHKGQDAAGFRVWPPTGCVLVAGPTPWGRDVPWAPVGWRP